jgi:hypothetical protein
VPASELLEIECRRVLQRYRLNKDLNDDGFLEASDRLERVLAGVTILGLTERVKSRAMQAFPVVVKTLDALHLATALIYAEAYLERERNERLMLFSHDQTMNRCARAVGLVAPFFQQSTN